MYLQLQSLDDIGRRVAYDLSQFRDSAKKMSSTELIFFINPFMPKVPLKYCIISMVLIPYRFVL